MTPAVPLARHSVRDMRHCRPPALKAGNGNFPVRPSRKSRLAVRVVAEPPTKTEKKTAAPAKAPPGSRVDAALSELDLKRLSLQVETEVAPQQRPPAPAKAPAEVPIKVPAPDIQWPPKRPFAAIALDNALDSATDIMRHLKRMSVPLPTKQAFGRLVRRGSPEEPLKLAPLKKPVLLVLGSGWGAHSLTKVIDHEMFDVVVVSPRNHFVFTPMLPSSAVGTVEFRSLLEPVRTSNPFVTYFEASCDSIDLASKTALCSSSFNFEDGRQRQFKVQYDKLVVAVGEQPASFGVPGVREHCFFMKEVTDCVELRMRIGRLFEACNLPDTADEQRYKNLHFVVVGGGPTGVEFAGTLADFVRQDLKKKYPNLMKYVKVTLLQSAQSILSTFQERLQQRALDNLRGQGVEVRLGVRVVEVTESQVVLKDGDRLDYGAVVWSAGNSARQLVKDLVAAVPEQAQYQRGVTPVTNKLAVDPFLRVIGARDVFALGDCSALVGSRLPTTAQVAAQQGSYLAHLINQNYDVGVGGMYRPPPSRPIQSAGPKLPALPPSLAPLKSFLMGGKAREEVGADIAAKLAAMEEPPWAEAARAARMGLGANSYPTAAAAAPVIGADGQGRGQGGNGLAGSGAGAVFGRGLPQEALDFHTRPFEFLSLGIMAYVGNDKALTQLEAFDIRVPLYGSFAFLLWRSVYITKQVSFRNRVLILFDWLKTQVFGRDLSSF